jgi:hypothetical protein
MEGDRGRSSKAIAKRCRGNGRTGGSRLPYSYLDLTTIVR